MKIERSYAAYHGLPARAHGARGAAGETCCDSGDTERSYGANNADHQFIASRVGVARDNQRVHRTAQDRVYVYRRYLEALAAEEEATPVGALVAPVA